MNNEQVIPVKSFTQRSPAEPISYAAAAAAWATLILAERAAGLPLAGKVLLITLGLALPILGLLLNVTRRAIAAREFLSLFYAPVGYVVLAVFAALSGLFFVFNVFLPGQPIDTAGLCEPIVLWILAPVTPAISMRLFSEEKRSGNLEALVTAPVTDLQLVVGKWIGAMGFLVVAMLTTVPLVLLLEIFGNPDYGPIFTGYVGMLLIGGLFLAIGAFASVTTHNQIISFLVALLIIALLIYINLILTNNYVSGALAQAMRYVNPYEQYRNFGRGILDTSNFVFFISTTAMFLTLAVKSLESRKWR